MRTTSDISDKISIFARYRSHTTLCHSDSYSRRSYSSRYQLFDFINNLFLTLYCFCSCFSISVVTVLLQGTHGQSYHFIIGHHQRNFDQLYRDPPPNNRQYLTTETNTTDLSSDLETNNSSTNSTIILLQNCKYFQQKQQFRKQFEYFRMRIIDRFRKESMCLIVVVDYSEHFAQ